MPGVNWGSASTRGSKSGNSQRTSGNADKVDPASSGKARGYTGCGKAQNGGSRGFRPPYKANRIAGGFSHGGPVLLNTTQIPEFFRSLFSRAKNLPKNKVGAPGASHLGTRDRAGPRLVRPYRSTALAPEGSSQSSASTTAKASRAASVDRSHNHRPRAREFAASDHRAASTRSSPR